MKLSDHEGSGDSVSLACLGEKPFTAIDIVRSDYDGKKGLKITTKESFKGSDLTLTEKAKMNMTDEDVVNFNKGEYNKFHTTRFAIVNQLGKESILSDLPNDKDGMHLKCVYVAKPKRGGNPYWEVKDVGL